MSAALHLAGPDDLGKLAPMVAAYHAFEGIKSDAEHIANALAPLLEGSPHGCAYLIGPRNAPIGYAVLTFGWSLEFGGLDGFVDELFIREGVRGRGIGTEALAALQRAMADAGLKALHLEVGQSNARAKAMYTRRGFRARDGFHLMSWQP